MKHIITVIGFSLLALFSATAPAEDSPRHETLFKEKINALITNNYEQFIAGGTAEFQAALKQAQFKDVAWRFGKQLKAGYSASYEGKFNQQGYDVYLWTVSYEGSDAANQYKMVLSGDKVAGFWIQ